MTTTISRPATPHPTPVPGSPDAISTHPTNQAPTPSVVASDGSNVLDRAARDQSAAVGVSLLDPALAFAADVLEDLERVRIATGNRVDVLTRVGSDKDGQERGFGLGEDHPDVAIIVAMLLTLQRLEHEATLNLQRKLRKHPLGAWVKAQRGVGEKQGARLLAAIGDPYINSAKGQPRTVSALWAYAGLHVLPGGQNRTDAQGPDAAGDQLRDTDPITSDALGASVGVAAKRRKGERANWSSKAKMRAYLIAESCVKQLDLQCRDGHDAADTQPTVAVPACTCSPYRVVYDERRVHTAATHPDWTDGHSHNDGLRVASKAILRDLWRAARDWHSKSVAP